MNRRTFIGVGAAALTGVVGLPVYATMVEPHWLELVQRDLPIANLPDELNGRTLAQVSDLHACTYVDEDYLCRSLDRLAAYSPDIIAFTGDFVTWQEWRPEAVRVAQLERVLSHLHRARLGTVGILGNHDMEIHGVTEMSPTRSYRSHQAKEFESFAMTSLLLPDWTSSVSTISGQVALTRVRLLRKEQTVLPSHCVTIPTDWTSCRGEDTPVGFSPGTRMADNASRPFFARLFCR